MSMKVNLDALTADAVLWEGVSGTLGSSSRSAAGLTLSSVSLSWAAEEVGLLDVYEAARARVERLLREGETETETIAVTLRQVRTAYESTDESERAVYRGIWDPK